MPVTDFIFQILIPTVLNGLSFGASLGLVALSLTIILGVLGVVNIAHGELYMLGAFVALSVLWIVPNFWVGLIASIVVIAIVGILIEILCLRPLYGKGHLFPLLSIVLTFGLSLFFREAARTIWGPNTYSIESPIGGTFSFLGFTYPNYRLLSLIMIVSIYLALWLFLNKTKAGIIIRAASEDREMLSCFGIDVRQVYTLTFALGASLAAIAGVIMTPMFSIYVEFGMKIILWSFIIVIIGGLGSLGGSVLTAFILAQTYSVGSIWLEPREMELLLFGLLIAILIARPRGFFGKRGYLE
jgi:branched-chain amino acid transport system permease protein